MQLVRREDFLEEIIQRVDEIIVDIEEQEKEDLDLSYIREHAEQFKEEISSFM